MARQLAQGVPLKGLSRHLLGLFHGQPGARAWRRTLSEQAFRADAGMEAIEAAQAKVRQVIAQQTDPLTDSHALANFAA